MKPRTVFLAFLFVCICACFVRAETSIEAEVDKTSVTTDELVTYKLSVVSTEKTLPSPKLPSFEGFAVVSQAQSSTVSYRKGGVQTILVFAFVLLPQKAEVLTIGPAQITVKDKTYASQALQINVKQGVKRLDIRPRRSVPDRQSVPPEDESFPQDLSSSQPRYNL